MDNISIHSSDTRTTQISASTTSSSYSTSLTDTITRGDIGNVNLDNWKSSEIKRYMLPNLIGAVDRGNAKKQDGDGSMSDAVVWNVYNLSNNNPLPSVSPSHDQRMKACAFVTKLKTALNAVFGEETQRMYCISANQEQWTELRVNGTTFNNFNNLVKRTRDLTSELVSTNCDFSHIRLTLC